MVSQQLKSLLATISAGEYQKALGKLQAGIDTGAAARIDSVFNCLASILKAPGITILDRIEIPAGEGSPCGWVTPGRPGKKEGSWPILIAEIPGGGAPYLTEEVIRTNVFIVPLNLDDEPRTGGAALAISLMKRFAEYSRKSGWKPQQSLRFFFTSCNRAMNVHLQQRRALGPQAFSALELDLGTGDETTQLTVDSAQFGQRSFVAESLVETLGKQKSLSVTESRGGISSLTLQPLRIPFARLSGTLDNRSVTVKAVQKALTKSIALLCDTSYRNGRAFVRPRLKQAAVTMRENPAEAGSVYADLTGMLRGFDQLLHRGPWWPNTEATTRRHRRQGHLIDNIYYPRYAYSAWLSKEMLKLQSLLPNPARKRKKTSDSTSSNRKADTFVPARTFGGALSLEDVTSTKAILTLKRLGARNPGILPEWMQYAANLGAGKKTISAIHRLLMAGGYRVSLQKVLDFFLLLEKCGKVCRKPIITERQIARALREVGIRKGDVVMAHVGYASYGYIESGPLGLIDVLQKAVGTKGTLCMPTHAGGIVGNLPFDRTTSPAGTGLVPNIFRSVPGTLRGEHPTHSVTARGPMAEFLLENNRAEVPVFGKEGFWGRLESSGGKILMLCNSLGPNTFLHGVDYQAGAPLPDTLCHIVTNGRRREIVARAVPFHVDSFSKIYQAAERKKLVHRAQLGEGTVYMMNAHEMMKVGAPVVRRNLLLATKADCTCDYCKEMRRVIARKKQRG